MRSSRNSGVPPKVLCLPPEIHAFPENPVSSPRNLCIPPKVLCVPPEIYVFPRKSYAFPPEIYAFPRKSYAFPQKFLRSPESPMHSPGNFCIPPKVLSVPPGIYTFPRKSSTFSRKIVEFGDLSEPPADRNTLFAAEDKTISWRARSFSGEHDHCIPGQRFGWRVPEAYAATLPVRPKVSVWA